MSGEWLLFINTLYNGMLLTFVSEMLDQRLTPYRKWMWAFASSSAAILLMPVWLSLICSFALLLYALPGARMRGALFLLLGSCLIGGLLTALQAYATATGAMQVGWLLLAAFSLAYVVRVWRLRWQLEKTFIVECELWLEQQCIRCVGFIDTGNVCIEPISALPVHFVALETLQSHAPPQLLAVMQGQRVDCRYAVREVYLSTVNGEQTIRVLQVDAIIVGQRRWENHYIAIVEKRPKFQQTVDVILHCSVLPNI